MDTNAAIIYIYRNWFHQTPTYKHLEIPIIPSIASFRAFDNTTPIYVIDTSEGDNEWLHYPEKLSFQVIKKQHAFRHVDKVADEVKDMKVFWSLLSKPLDIYDLVSTLDHEVYVVADADVFFVQPLFPLLEDPNKHFVCGTNTGMFYFHKNKPATAQVFETWSSLCALSMLHPRIRRKVRQPHHPTVQEECVYCYMLACHSERLHLKPIPIYENFIGPYDKTFNHGMIKVLHMAGYFGRPRRGMVGICIKEIRCNIEQVLTKQEMEQVFGNIDIDTHSITEDDLIRKVIRAIE